MEDHRDTPLAPPAYTLTRTHAYVINTCTHHSKYIAINHYCSETNALLPDYKEAQRVNVARTNIGFTLKMLQSFRSIRVTRISPVCPSRLSLLSVSLVCLCLLYVSLVCLSSVCVSCVSRLSLASLSRLAFVSLSSLSRLSLSLCIYLSLSLSLSPSLPPTNNTRHVRSPRRRSFATRWSTTTRR
jgi:hypothetical protein